MRTRKYVESRVERFTRYVKARDGCEWVLSAMNPGDGTRFQIVEQEKRSGTIHRTLPYGGHWLTKDFDAYVSGLIDALELMEG